MEADVGLLSCSTMHATASILRLRRPLSSNNAGRGCGQAAGRANCRRRVPLRVTCDKVSARGTVSTSYGWLRVRLSVSPPNQTYEVLHFDVNHELGMFCFGGQRCLHSRQLPPPSPVSIMQEPVRISPAGMRHVFQLEAKARPGSAEHPREAELRPRLSCKSQDGSCTSSPQRRCDWFAEPPRPA